MGIRTRGKGSTMDSWRGMHKRCYQAKTNDFKQYGGRGIVVCDRWHTFENFVEDMGARPEGKTLDRIDPNGNYSKENCRWATQKEQQRNRRNNLSLSLNGYTRIATEWQELSGLKKPTFFYRLYNGWSLAEIMATPVGGSKCG